MPTIEFVVDGHSHVVEADRVMRDSQQYVAERREGGQWVTVAAWPREAVSAVQRQIDRPASRWFPEDVRTSAGLDQRWSEPTRSQHLDLAPARASGWGTRWLTRSAQAQHHG